MWPRRRWRWTTEIPDIAIGRFFFDAAGKQLFAVSCDQMHVLDVATGKWIRTLKSGGFRQTAVSPDRATYRLSPWFPPAREGIDDREKDASQGHVQVILRSAITGSNATLNQL